MKIKILLIVMLTAIVASACTSDEQLANTASGNTSDKLIQVLPQVGYINTRAGWNNTNLMQNNSEFGLFFVPITEKPMPDTEYHNARMVYKNGVWNDYAPNDLEATTPLKKLYWSNKQLNVQVIAYMPYRTDVSALTTITGKIGTEQNQNSQGESVTANDILHFNGVVKPTATTDKWDAYGNIIEYAPIDGKLAIPFRHVASKLNLKITIGTSFNLAPSGTTTNPITNLKINGTVCDYDFNLSTGALSKNADATASVNPWFDANTYAAGESYTRKAVANYECILVPQTIAANVFSVSLTIGGKNYEWVSEAPVKLLAGKQHNLTLNAGENSISLSDFTIDEWGITNVPVEPDLASPVEIDEAQSSVSEGVELSIANRQLHFDNRGGTATIAFAGDFDKKYEIIDADPRLEIESQSGAFNNSVFKITANQVMDSGAYSVRLRVSNPLLTTNDGIEITIYVDATLIPSVEMAGLEWMAFNGIGRDPYLYLYDSRKTIREIYAEDWDKFSGVCMWGPREIESPILYPSEVIVTPNFTSTAITTSTPNWTPEHKNIPCPEGWRLPTHAELRKIWPGHRAYLKPSSTYTNDGITYTASIVNSGAPDITVEGNPSIKTNLLIISDGKNELIFPLSGRRMQPNTNSTPQIANNAGEEFFVWSQDHIANSSRVEVVGMYSDRAIYNTTNANIIHSIAETFQSVRCVKIK